MLSNTIPCSAQDIKNINQQKEYTLISTKLLELVFSDSRLNDHEIKCWQLLFNKTRFTSNLEITISYNALAYALCKSKRTIMRYIQTLTKHGYVEIIHNEDQRCGKKPNTLLIRVPLEVMETVRESKNRAGAPIQENFNTANSSFIGIKKSYLSKNLENTTQPTINVLIKSQRDLEITCVIDEALETENTENTLCPLSVLKAEAALCEITHLDPPEKIDAKCIDNPVPMIPTIEAIACEPTVEEGNVTLLSSGPSDNHDTLINNIINNKENNNNSVVFLENKINKNDEDEIKDPPELIALEEKKKNIEHQLNIENQKLKTVLGNSTLTLQQLNLIGQLEKNKISLANEISKSKKQGRIHQVNNLLENQLTATMDHFLNKPGDRLISSFTFKRMVKTLQSYGFSESSLNWLCNEVVFEVRFGSLIYSSTTKDPMGVDHAINIALKLIREKRWSTPVLFRKMIGGKN